MADTSSNDYVGQFFQLANTFAVPFAKSLANDTTSTKDAQKVSDSRMQEIVRDSMLNGSGPNNPDLALQSAPTSLFDFINGKQPATGQAATGTNWKPWALIALGAIALIYVAKKM